MIIALCFVFQGSIQKLKLVLRFSYFEGAPTDWTIQIKLKGFANVVGDYARSCFHVISPIIESHSEADCTHMSRVWFGLVRLASNVSSRLSCVHEFV